MIKIQKNNFSLDKEIDLIKSKKKVFVYPIYENWTDIGSYNEYLKVK